jgi:hypothetical protein
MQQIVDAVNKVLDCAEELKSAEPVRFIHAGRHGSSARPDVMRQGDCRALPQRVFTL